MRRIVLPIISLATTLGWVGVPKIAEACSVCFGNPDSSHSQGMKYGILVLLAFTVAVLGAFGAFFLSLMRRSKVYEATAAARPLTDEIHGSEDI